MQEVSGHPLLGPSKIPGGAHPTRFSQKVRTQPLRQFLGSQIHSLFKSRMWLTSTKWSTDFLTSIHAVYTLPILPSCIAFMRIKYYLILYILQHSHPSTCHADPSEVAKKTPSGWDVLPHGGGSDIQLDMHPNDGMFPTQKQPRNPLTPWMGCAPHYNDPDFASHRLQSIRL